METLFRFAQIRSATEVEVEEVALDLTQITDFQKDLSSANRNTRKSVAERFISSNKFVSNYKMLPEGEKIDELRAFLRQQAQSDEFNSADFRSAIENILGSNISALVSSAGFKSLISNIKDSIVAIKYLPEAHTKPIAKLTSALRAMEMVRNAAEDAEFPQDIQVVKKALRINLLLPTEVDGSSILKPRIPRRPPDLSAATKLEKDFNDLLEQYTDTSNAILELGNVSTDKIVNTASKASKAVLPSKGLRPWSLFAGKVGLEGGTATNPDGTDSTVVSRPSLDGTTLGSLVSATGVDIQGAQKALKVAVSGQTVKTTYAGRSGYTPDDNLQHGLRLTDAAIRALPQNVTRVLSNNKITLKTLTLDNAVQQLQTLKKSLGAQLTALVPKKKKFSIGRKGKGLLTTNILNYSSADKVAKAIQTIPGQAFFWGDIFKGTLSVPTSHGDITPAGVADLLVIKQQLTGYEGKDVAHIENILKGELKSREHSIREETEIFTSTETETTVSSERELESTDRFEMSRESSKKVEEKASIKGSLSVTAKYGPVVEVSASVEASAERAREEATKSASSFSQEITQSSSESITERVLEQETLRITKEIEETNTHSIDNTDGDGHISGVYQWVEKVYEAQIFNYGLRTMYDFMIPEPGAYLVDALQEAHNAAMEVEKPIEFTLEPDEIEEDEIQFWIQEYNATDIEPPPEIYITQSFDYSIGGGDDKTDYNHSGQVQIPDGYQAISASVARVANIWDDDWTVDMAVGSRVYRFDGNTGWVWSTSLTNERDSVPFAINTFQVSDLAIAGEVKCQRTDRAMEQWRYDTHTKLTQAYQAKLSEYEEKLTELELQAGVAIEGLNPDANLTLIKEELKKASITILTEQHFDLFGAIESDSDGRPQIDLSENELEGPYVRFFEQAFEWEQMSYVTYPYFWGRKSTWEDKLGFDDTDPVFNDFIKSGYCRLVVPVRPGFEGAVDHFMTFGEPWMGGPLPTVSSEHYLPIAEELAELSGQPGDEVPEGDPWEIRIPTNLVKLRDDDQLPTWEKDEDGNWVEA